MGLLRSTYNKLESAILWIFDGLTNKPSGFSVKKALAVGAFFFGCSWLYRALDKTAAPGVFPETLGWVFGAFVLFMGASPYLVGKLAMTFMKLRFPTHNEVKDAGPDDGTESSGK